MSAVSSSIPNWTALPPLRLRGVETGLVESLDHYALRMADTCGITRPVLVSLLRRSKGLPADGQHSQYLSSWTGPRSDYLKLLEPLAEKSGQSDLFRGTFHNVAEVLGRGGLASRTGRESRRRWCPRCYLDWDDEYSYEPLAWAFNMLAACPIHNVFLEGACRNCGREQSFNRNYSSRRSCMGCDRPLGGKGEVAPLIGEQSWIDARLVRFSHFVARLDESIERATYDVFLTAMLERQEAGEVFPPAIRQYVNEQLRTRKLRASIPTITQYLNICAFQGTEIEDLLLAPREAAAMPLFGWGEDFGRVRFGRRILAPKLLEIGACMEALLADPSIRLLPMGLLSRHFGLWGDVVRDNFPDTHRMYVERHAAQMGEFTRVYERAAFECAFHMLDHCKDKGISAATVKKICASVAALTNVSPSTAVECVKAVVLLHKTRRRINLRDS
ncbi:TniQ family protein [Luteimonas padinae]|uniref:TniQ family protein n=1 Tax=Luteimonas padinae TaxID=1714359 RepID=A0ABV6SVN4_9GAMM|nr:TniQ family protein [Luteimonas padinae]